MKIKLYFFVNEMPVTSTEYARRSETPPFYRRSRNTPMIRFAVFMNTDIVDGVKGLKNKNKYASKYSHRVPDVHNSFLINYMGREDWGEMTDYIERAHIITDAHLLFEILDVGDKFCISLMQMNKKKKYMDYFCQILDEEKIPYKIHGVYKNHLPISKLESAPICEK